MSRCCCVEGEDVAAWRGMLPRGGGCCRVEGEDVAVNFVVVCVQDLSNALISQWKKEAMRSSLKQLKKVVIDFDKTAKAKLVQLVRV